METSNLKVEVKSHIYRNKNNIKGIWYNVIFVVCENTTHIILRDGVLRLAGFCFSVENGKLHWYNTSASTWNLDEVTIGRDMADCKMVFTTISGNEEIRYEGQSLIDAFKI